MPSSVSFKTKYDLIGSQIVLYLALFSSV